MAEELRKLKRFYEEGFITQQEYDERRKQIIDQVTGTKSGASGGTSGRSTRAAPSSRATGARATGARPSAARSGNPSRATSASRRTTQQPQQQQQQRRIVPISEQMQRASVLDSLDPSQVKPLYPSVEERAPMPQPRRGMNAPQQRVKMPAFTISTLHQPPKPKVYLGPKRGNVPKKNIVMLDKQGRPVGANPNDTGRQVRIHTEGVVQRIVDLDRRYKVSNIVTLMSSTLGLSSYSSQFGIVERSVMGTDAWVDPDVLMVDLVAKLGTSDVKLVFTPKDAVEPAVRSVYERKVRG